ncbi:MAG: pyridoxal-phosphate dependent enzyme [Acidimicrobiales bacterium]
MAVLNSVLDMIGNTPIVDVSALSPNPNARILAKMEGQNPGGSVKDRIARSMILAAEADGTLNPGKTIIEPSSGNTGIALAMIARQRGYPIKIVLPGNVSVERRQMLEVYGAEIIDSPGEEGSNGAVRRAVALADEHPEWVFLHQYANEANPRGPLRQHRTGDLGRMSSRSPTSWPGSAPVGRSWWAPPQGTESGGQGARGRAADRGAGRRLPHPWTRATSPVYEVGRARPCSTASASQRFAKSLEFTAASPRWASSRDLGRRRARYAVRTAERLDEGEHATIVFIVSDALLEVPPRPVCGPDDLDVVVERAKKIIYFVPA